MIMYIGLDLTTIRGPFYWDDKRVRFHPLWKPKFSTVVANNGGKKVTMTVIHNPADDGRSVAVIESEETIMSMLRETHWNDPDASERILLDTEYNYM